MRWLVLIQLLCFCGKAGIGHRGVHPGVVEVPIITKAEELNTRVPVENMSYGLLDSPICLREQSGQIFPKLTAMPTIDGDLSDWPPVTEILIDPVGDAPAASDLKRVSAGLTDRELFLAVDGPMVNATVVIEFFGMVMKDKKITRETRRLFKISPEKVEDFDLDWISLSPDFYSLQRKNGSTELKISRRIIGDTFSWPLWGIRVYSADNLASHVLDSTSVVWFSSLLKTDGENINITVCRDWAGRNAEVALQEVSFGSRAAGENEFARYRSVLNSVTAFLGQSPLPSSQHSVLLSQWSGVPLEASHPEASHREIALSGSFVNQNLSGSESQAGDGFALGFAADAEGLFKIWVATSWPTASAKIQSSMVVALVDQFMRKNIGLAFWLDHFPEDPGSYSELFLTDRTTLLTPKDAVQTKPRDFGHLLGLSFTTAQLLSSWRDAAKISEAGTSEENIFPVLLATITESASKARLSRLQNGWLNNQNFDDEFKPSLLKDTDFDGIFDFYEAMINTNRESADSDFDGWSDLAELLTKTDPLNQSLAPKSLIADGNFDDWLQLVPQRIHSDDGAKGACPKSGDIVQYGAILGKSGIMIGANSKDFWRDTSTRWVATVEGVDGISTLTLDSKTGSRYFTIQRNYGLKQPIFFFKAVPVGVNSVEWFLANEYLPQESSGDLAVALRIKIATVYSDGKDGFCDETDWFQPLITD